LKHFVKGGNLTAINADIQVAQPRGRSGAGHDRRCYSQQCAGNSGSVRQLPIQSGGTAGCDIVWRRVDFEWHVKP
jgi:hypothetical protein